MAALVQWLVLVPFGMAVAVALALVVLPFRYTIRAAALGYSVTVLAGYLPIVLRDGAVLSPADILPTMVISVIFAMPGTVLSVVGAALLFKLPAPQPLARRVMSIAIGVVLGTCGGFVGWASVTRGCDHAMFPWWGALMLGVGAGACWGILAPSVIPQGSRVTRTTSPEEMERLRRLRDVGHLRYVLLYGVICSGMGCAVTSALLISWWKPFFDVLPWAALAFGVGYALVGEVGWRLLCSRRDRDERGPPA